MEGDRTRPSIVSKRTEIRRQKHDHLFPAGLPTPPRAIDAIIASLGYASIGAYVYHNYKKLSPWELAGLSVGSATLGYGLFGLGKRNDLIQGAGFALRSGREQPSPQDRAEDAWKGEFRGMEFESLSTVEKIAWLKKENQRIKELQEVEQLKCGQAYIAKEEAYEEYEKHGHYGGTAWKAYVDADSVCQEMYNAYEKQQKRLGEIRREINELSNEL